MPIIEVNHVTKEYRPGHMKSLKQSVLGAMDRLRGRPAPKQEPFKALDNIDFKKEKPLSPQLHEIPKRRV